MKLSLPIKIIQLTLFIIPILLFIGCGTTTTITMKDYADQKLDGKNLGVITLFNKPDIENTSDVTDDLGPGIPGKVYMNFFIQRVKFAVLRYSGFKSVNFMDKKSASSLLERTLVINNNDTLSILLPEDNARIETDSVHPEYILFIKKIIISRSMDFENRLKGNFENGKFENGKWVAGNGLSGSMFVPTLTDNIYHHIYFAIWDNIKGKLVSYGSVDDKSQLSFWTMTKSKWESITSLITRKILESAPFQ
jgi:hypothetical protein